MPPHKQSMEANPYAFRARKYAMKKHRASRLHFDLRLEWNGVLLSWALPVDLGYGNGSLCEAVEMEDHRVKNLQFEGLHKENPIMLWDLGTWEPYPASADVEKSLREGILQFHVCGEKLQGDWTLTRSNRRNPRPVWILSMKTSEGNYERVLTGQPNSIATGRTLGEIYCDWTSPKPKREGQSELFG